MIAGIAFKALNRTTIFRFATASEIAQKTHERFQKKYSENQGSFKAKMDEINKRHAEVVKPLNQKAYIHPYDTPHHPINFSAVKTFELFSDFIGPEQVSAHYENFLMSRRVAVTFWVGAIALVFCISTTDLHWIARSLLFPWLTYFCYLYFYLEGKKSLMKPLLARFYRRIMTLEINNIETYYHENIQARVRALMAIAKSQLEYKNVHNDYKSVRNNSIMNFLINEQINLKNHIDNRALNVLKQTEAFEEINQRKIINQLVASAVKSLDEAYATNKQKIEAQMFELALQGLEKGTMDYSKDPILPHIIERIRANVESFDKLSKEEQDNLIQLSDDQIQSIRNNDTRMKDEFLTNEPKIEGALRNHETVAKILANWGKGK